MLRKLHQFIKLKSGIAENSEHLQQLESRLQRQLEFLASWQQLMAPELIPIAESWLEEVSWQLKEKYDCGDFATAISKNDIMFAYHLYANGTAVKKAVAGYFRVGCTASHALRQILDQRQLQPASLLDFGSGYGRMSRFLPGYFPESDITVSEVKPLALKFQQQHLGLKTLSHGPSPADFPATKFDAIVALSVFTHLPQTLFEAWFATLVKALNPGGSLVLTYKDLEIEQPQAVSQSGSSEDFLYLKKSEDALFPFVEDSNLDEQEYGVSFVRRSYLQQLAGAEGLSIEFLGDELARAQQAAILKKDH